MVKFLKSQPVLSAAFAAALVTVFIVPPDKEYIGYVNHAVLIQLFSLMLAVAGMRSIGVFEKATQLLLEKAGSVRRLGLVFVLMCYFSSMLVTNDVALITFVPLTLLTFEGISHKSLIITIVLETVAANLGSMLTPIGNPQNLFLYDHYGLSFGTFISTTAPAGLFSLAVMIGLTFLLPKEKCAVPAHKETNTDRVRLTFYSLLFVICLMTVSRLVSEWVCLGAAVIMALIFDPKLLLKVDYLLLATFVCFFVFVGNIGRVDAVRDLFSQMLEGRELIVTVGLSQVISNVPAAVMLSGFTDSAEKLLLGVNIGGLGTLIASLASLISFQYYRNSKGAATVRYMLIFSAVNFGMLAVMLLFAFVTGAF